jgi:hypothetical protein
MTGNNKYAPVCPSGMDFISRPGSIKKAQDKEYQEIIKAKEKKTEGNPDDGAADGEPFDAKHNNMHGKR